MSAVVRVSLPMILLVASAACSQSIEVGGDADADGDMDSDVDGDVDIDGDVDGDGDADGDGCLPSEICDDGVDNDCDGEVDEECSESTSCVCVPGAERWCDDPTYSEIGVQECAEDGSEWLVCRAISIVPESCEGIDGWYSPDFENCLIDRGHCARDEWDLDHDGDLSESMGSCEGIDCAQGGCLCRPGQWRWCDLAYISLWGRQFCDDDGAAWGRCDEDGYEPPEACVREGEGWYSPEFETCMIERGECIHDVWDLDGDGDSWESLGSCSGIACVES